MNSHQVQLVKSSWIRVLEIQHLAAELFYRRLFTLAPEVQPMFKRDIAAQGATLIATLNTAVNCLDRLDAVLPSVRALARRHVPLGVTAEHYAAVGTALLWTLREGLGEAYTEAVHEAWARAYAVLSGAMKAAAYLHQRRRRPRLAPPQLRTISAALRPPWPPPPDRPGSLRCRGGCR